MKRSSPNNIVSLPARPVTLAAIMAELLVQREMIERLVAQPQPVREWVTVDEAAALVHRTPQAIRARCRSRRIGIKIGRSWRIDRAQLFSHF
jgi:hypothetical protein